MPGEHQPDCLHHKRSGTAGERHALSVTGAAMALRRGGGGALAGGGGGGGGPPRLVVAVGVAALAAGIGLVRRASRGPTRDAPPVAEKRPHTVPFGEPVVRTNVDDYFWLRDDKRERPEVIEHLKAENAYTNYMTLPLRRRADVLYKEMLSHTQETDMDVPTPHGPWEYYVRTVKGSSYAFHCRRAVGADGVKGEEQVLLDENELAKGKKHCDVATVEVSPDHRLMAVAVDYTGDEKYTIDFYDIASEKKIEGASIAETNGFVDWGRDNDTVFYGTMDEAHRSNKVWKHDMTGGSGDVCLFTENDEVFSAYFGKTLSDRFLFIISAASKTSEYRYIDLETPGFDVHLVAERKDDILYSVEHAGGDRFLITTNADGATNFKVLEGTVGADPQTWAEFLAYKPERTILGLTCFEKFTVVSGREGGFAKLWIMEDTDPGTMYELEVDEESSVVSLGANMEYKTDKVRFLYSSMTTPKQTYDYEIASRERTLLKETPVPKYDRSLYKTERLEAVAEDGTKIPISLVWNEKAVRQDSPNFLHLYGYASYGISIDPSFSPNVLPLLDRGVVYAIAHCRGGGEGGRSWYEAARFETKPKSFSDFVSCAELLVSSGRTTPGQLSMEGRSAGGLLMGAVMNLRPELFRAVIAGVPFVDVLNTMSDKTIPLTTQETQEWGDPNDCGKYYDAIKSYCPYQNVAVKPYPAALVVAGLHDPRVLYSEPTKWVAKLREHTTSDREIILKVDLDSGHFSASDRYKYKRERAFELAWLLNQLGAPVGKLTV